MAVLVMTYNINYGQEGNARTLAAIRDADADCVFLQETTPRWEAALMSALAEQYPYVGFRHWRKGRAGGLGVLSKVPFRDQDYLDGPTGWFPAWRVVVDFSEGPVQVLNVHLRPVFSVASGFHRNFFSTGEVRLVEIRAHFGRIDPTLPTLVVGDFNEGDGAAVRYLHERGMRSALAVHQPGATTWRLWRATRLYDHIMHTANLVPVTARVLEVGASDHMPVLARFQREAT